VAYVLKFYYKYYFLIRIPFTIPCCDGLDVILTLPLLNFTLSKTKMFILNEIKSKNTNIPSIVTKSGKQKSIIYQHVKDLKAEGYLTQDLELSAIENKLSKMGFGVTVRILSADVANLN